MNLLTHATDALNVLTIGTFLAFVMAKGLLRPQDREPKRVDVVDDTDYLKDEDRTWVRAMLERAGIEIPGPVEAPSAEVRQAVRHYTVRRESGRYWRDDCWCNYCREAEPVRFGSEIVRE